MGHGAWGMGHGELEAVPPDMYSQEKPGRLQLTND
jgi:hypothetical protein